MGDIRSSINTRDLTEKLQVCKYMYLKEKQQKKINTQLGPKTGPINAEAVKTEIASAL